MRKTVTILLALLLAFGTSTALAAKGNKKKPAKTPEQVFARHDKNGDGALSLAELVGKRTGEKATKAEQVFKRLDKDGDGKLTLAEFKARKGKKKP